MVRLRLLFDAHFHARDFNEADKGTFATETQAALISGVGRVFCMPNTDPPLLTNADILHAQSVAGRDSYCDAAFYLGTNGENIIGFYRPIPSIKGLKAYLGETTGNLLLKDPTVIRRIFRNWEIDKPILVHVEDLSLLKLVLRLAEEFDRRVHICHVSTKQQTILVRSAKMHNLMVTAEACPHHLLFTEGDLANLGPYGIMKPQLAQTEDQEWLWIALADGTIDIIATDHAPHTPEEKAGEKPPYGVIGQGAFFVMWKAFYDRGWALEKLVKLMGSNPEEIFCSPSERQSSKNCFMDFDPEPEWVFDNSMVVSKACFSPYHGLPAKGVIRSLVLHGFEVVKDGKLVSEHPRGKIF